MADARADDAGPHAESIEAVATAINWIGLWGQADFNVQSLRSDALAWSGDEVRRFVASGGREAPPEERHDLQDSPCPYTGAGASWDVDTVPTPWWVEAGSHTEGPADDESIPRKLEGWWRVEEYERDGQLEVGEDLVVGNMCLVEKLWSDRIRVYRTKEPTVFGEVPVERACDLQLMRKSGAAVGSRWDLLRDVGEGGDDPDEIRVGQTRVLLGGEYGPMKLKGLEVQVLSYVEFMDRWTVEIPFKNQQGKNIVIAVVPSQLCEPKMPRDPKENGKVTLDLSLRSRSLELNFRDERLRVQGPGSGSFAGGVGDGRFRLRLRYVSRVRPGGRVWTSSPESIYKYVEVRYVGSGDYGIVYRVLRMVDSAKRKQFQEDEEDPHLVLDVAHGSDKAAVIKAYRKLARRWHPDKVPEDERERAVDEFRRIHQAYENLMADPERSSDLMVLKMQRPGPPKAGKKVSVPMAFHTEIRCLTLVSQLRLPNVAKLVEAGENNQFIVTWPYLPEALVPNNEPDGFNQVDRIDMVRQGWSDFSRSKNSAKQVIRTMLALIRHDVMVVDPVQNVIVERESGEPLFIDFGRGETAGSIYATRIRTFMKKILQLLIRSVAKASYDLAAKFIYELEDTLFEELEKWQDEKTRDMKKAVALMGQSTKWQEGIQVCRDIWASDDDNPFRKMFKDNKEVLPVERKLRAARELEDDDEDSDAEKPPEDDDDPDGLCDADIETLTPVQRLLRAKRKKKRRAALPKEKPNVRVKIDETLPDGRLGLGLDDAPEDMRGLMIVQIDKKMQQHDWQIGDRVVELNGQEIDDWEDLRRIWEGVKQFNVSSVVFGLVRWGVELEPQAEPPSCLHCGVQGSHLQKCTTWKPLPEGQECVYFCGRDCQKEAWKLAKRKATA